MLLAPSSRSESTVQLSGSSQVLWLVSHGVTKHHPTTRVGTPIHPDPDLQRVYSGSVYLLVNLTG